MVPISRRSLAAGGIPFLLSGPAAAQAPETGPVKLGLLLDMSGPYADITGPGSETAARMAVEDFGAAVLGRPITVLVADHQNKSDVAAAIASRWFDQEGVTQRNKRRNSASRKAASSSLHCSLTTTTYAASGCRQCRE